MQKREKSTFTESQQNHYLTMRTFLGFRILPKDGPFLTDVQLKKFLSDSSQIFRSILIQF